MTGRLSQLAAALFLCSIVVGAAGADQVAITPTKDNTMFSNENSNGIGDAVFSGRTGSGGGGVADARLLAFDVAGNVPAGSIVTSATLTLELVRSSSLSQLHTLHTVLSDWGEGTSNGSGGEGAPPTVGDATWTWSFFPDVLWGTPGGDFTPVFSAFTFIVLEPGPVTWGPTVQMTADVQGWLDDPATNFGWMVRGNDGTERTAKKLASKDHPDPLLHPVLVIEFDPPDCPQDLDGSGDVGFQDILRVLGAWGPCKRCPEDLDGSGDVGFGDLIQILGNWGPCD